MSTQSRHVEVIYCDDIRAEMGNKTSLMGIYNGDMLITAFPALLSKLCIVVSAVTDANDPFQKINVRVTKDEDSEGKERTEILTTGDVPINAPELEMLKHDGVHWHSAQLHFSLSPFHVEKPTVLHVTVETEKGSMQGRGLKILAMTPNIIKMHDERVVKTT